MTPYDTTEYPAKPFVQCHPDRLAVMATLFGLAPAPVNACRLLEIGCGDGLNLIAEAVTLPGSEFVGIDLSHAAIARGQEMIRELNLANVRLEEHDLLDFEEAGGAFDFVVAHGLYAWVPPEVRDVLLAVVKRSLAPNGIAFISYNAYPGAFLPRMIREMTLRSGQQRKWLETARRLTCGSSLYRALVQDEAGNMLQREPGFLWHDDLAEVYLPVYFTDFMHHASAHGLQFVSEAELGAMGKYGLSIDAASEVEQLAPGDRIAQEQYADFLMGRRYRQTLLCHHQLAVHSTPHPGALGPCFAGGPITREGDEFVSQLGGRMKASNAEVSSLLQEVASRWPTYIPIEASEPLLELFAARMLDVRTQQPPVAGRIANRPQTSKLARFQIERGSPATSLHHFKVVIENSSLRALVLLMDGTRTRAALIRDLGLIFPSAAKDQVIRAVDIHMEEARNLGLLCR